LRDRLGHASDALFIPARGETPDTVGHQSFLSKLTKERTIQHPAESLLYINVLNFAKSAKTRVRLSKINCSEGG